MGQIRKLIPQGAKDAMFDAVNNRLAEDSFIRNHLADGVTGMGVGLVAVGSELDRRGYRKSGLLFRVVGQAADDVDGDIARAFEIDGQSGAWADATADKLKVALEVATLWRHANEMEDPDDASRRKRNLTIIMAKHGTNAALNTATTALGGEASSSFAGTVNMYADAIAFEAMGLDDVIDDPKLSSFARKIETVSVASGVAIGAVAAAGYGRDLINTVAGRSSVPVAA